MRIVTTAPKFALEPDGYAHRWLESRDKWPTHDHRFYTEDADAPIGDRIHHTFDHIHDYMEWKAKHEGYVPPAWQWDVVRYSHKVFAAIDALYDYEGIGVWLDADCVTYQPIPEGLIEKQVEGVYLAHYGRTGLYTETGLWVMNCAHPQHKEFLDTWRSLYFSERYQQLSQWTDCHTLDATIRLTGVPTFNLSGEFHKDMHPQAKSELGQYIDHCKGGRKIKGHSPENKHRKHDPSV